MISIMKSILVPCNFSRQAELAFQFALELASTENSEIFVLTVLKSNDSGSEERNKVEKESAGNFARLIQNHNILNIPVTHILASGQITSAVLDTVEKKNIDLIVMGTHGSRGWNEFFMGSNIEKVVRISPVPVFAVKSSTPLRSIHNIVFPTSLKSDQPEIIEKIKTLQKNFRARLHILRINTSENRHSQITMDQMNDYALHHALTNFTLTIRQESDVKEGIIRFAREINADMIAMATHGNRDPKNMYSQSVAADIVNHANMLIWTCSTSKSNKSLHSVV